MLEEKVFFEMVALHSCQLRIGLKHLVTTCDFNNLCSRSVALEFAAIWKTKLFAGAFQKFLQKIKHLLSRTLFVDRFRYIERITEGKLKCLLHTALISNAFFDESKDKRKRYSLKSVRSEGTKWKIQYLLKLKTHLVSFVFGLDTKFLAKTKTKDSGQWGI